MLLKLIELITRNGTDNPAPFVATAMAILCNGFLQMLCQMAI